MQLLTVKMDKRIESEDIVTSVSTLARINTKLQERIDAKDAEIAKLNDWRAHCVCKRYTDSWFKIHSLDLCVITINVLLLLSTSTVFTLANEFGDVGQTQMDSVVRAAGLNWNDMRVMWVVVTILSFITVSLSKGASDWGSVY